MALNELTKLRKFKEKIDTHLLTHKLKMEKNEENPMKLAFYIMMNENVKQKTKNLKREPTNQHNVNEKRKKNSKRKEEKQNDNT